MEKGKRHISKTIKTTVNIHAKPEEIWENITNVKIEQFSDPFLFKLLGIPKPLRAELIAEDVGGSRIAYFNSGKKFIQKILVWKPYTTYAFSFNPEKGFMVGYLFDLSDGVFQIPTGAYYLSDQGEFTTLRLQTQYTLDKRFFFIFNLPVRLILKAFKRYLLTSIKKNVE